MVPDLRPRGIGEILDAAAVLYRSQFGVLVRYAAIVVVPVQAFLAVVLISAQPDEFSVSISGSAQPQFETTSAELAAAVVVLVVGLITNAFIVAVTTRVVANQYVDHAEGNARLLSNTGRRFFAVIGVSVIVAILQLVGIFACFVGSLAVMAFFAVAIPALLLERKRVGGALSRSIELTKGHFWHVLGVVLTATLIGTLLNASLAAALNIFARSSSPTTLVLAQGVANTVASILTTPFVAAATVALYFDLRIRDEAFDVQMAMAGAPGAR
jgi:hypothetical protein